MIALVRSSSAASAHPALHALIFLFGAGLAGCAGETGILVEVTSPDLVVPSDVDALRFEAVGPAGVMAQGVFPIASAWPHSLAIRPPEGDDSGSVSITVVGLKAGATVATTTVASSFRSGETSTVRVVLSRCVGAACMPMDGGMDLGVDLGADAGELPDGGVDDLGSDDGGDVDLGSSDLGLGDLGTTDLGSADMGRVDLGRDAGPPDLGSDLGPLDLGVDLGASDLGTTPSLVGSLVISELATGRLSGSDEFVELYNRTAVPLDIGGVTMGYRSSAGASYLVRATVPAGTMLPAYSYYLIGSVGYTGTPTPDLPMAWTSGFASAAGHVNLARGTETIDLIGWGVAAIAPEGTAAPGFSTDTSRSYERKADAASSIASMTSGADIARGNGHDTNDNGADLIVRATRDPQNAASTAELP